MERSRTSYDALASMVMTVGGCSMTKARSREALAREAAERKRDRKPGDEPPSY